LLSLNIGSQKCYKEYRDKYFQKISV